MSRFVLDTGKLIGKLHGRYRKALRQGKFDSKEELGALSLSFELEGSLVCVDEGLRKRPDKVSIEIIHPLDFRRILEKAAGSAGI